MSDNFTLKKVMAHPHVYVLSGSEKNGCDVLARQTFLKTLIEKILPDTTTRLMSLFEYDMKEKDVTIAMIMECTQEYSLFGPQNKVIIVQHADFLTASKSDEQMALIQAYALQPQAHTWLFFIINGTVDKRKKVNTTLTQLQHVIEFPEATATMVRQAIHQQLQKEKRLMDEAAIDYLLEVVNNKMAPALNELEKVICYANAAHMITLAHIQATLTYSTEHSIFEMCDALIAKNATLTLKTYAQLRQQKEEPLSILMLLARQLRIMLAVKQAVRDKIADSELAKQLNVPPFVLNKYRQQVREWSEKQLSDRLKRLIELDVDIKTGRTKADMGLELWMLRFIG
jgi:DNA polymerase-3 subunit delta